MKFLQILQTKLFPNFKRFGQALYLKRETKYFIKDRIYRLGTVNFDDVDVHVLEIQQHAKNDPRVTITRDAFKLMKDHGIDRALIVFWSEDSPNYRLSLLTLQYAWKWVEESSPKRYSFLLWPHEKVKTANDYLIKKWPIQNFEDLISRFDVEVVRKEFFRLYLNLFLELYKSLRESNNFQEEIISNKKHDPVKFAKNLMGKIIFLYFVQKKWWLWVSQGKERGQWDLDFIKTLLDDSRSGENMLIDQYKRKGNFYNDYLEPLFYEWLNQDRRWQDDIHPYFKSKDNESLRIPYLNWWLFSDEYDRKNTDILPNNKIFEDIILSFDTYNFTIDEDDPYDREIAIDPEMLGKIFETMISVSIDNIEDILQSYEKKTKWSPLDIENIQHVDIENELNKKFGAFYTPREIVHYMTKESLLYYLVNWLKERGRYAQGQSDYEIQEYLENKVRLLLKYKENYLTLSDVKSRKELEQDVEVFFDVVNYINRLLDDIKILDPAVWSGAFPMGLLHEIWTLKKYINDVFLEKNITDYEIKKNIISNSIYGVDIEPGAIDIARLRFWLSLLVDTDKPEPLPNLEFKFVCADTLTPLYDKKNTLDLYQNNVMFEKYKFYMQKLFYPTKDYTKEDSMQRLRHFIWYFQWKDQTEFNQKLKTFDPFNSDNSAKFFDPELMFGEEKFDIVIWNPPYIQLQKNWWFLANLYEKVGYQSFTRTWDIYCLFYEHAFELLKEGGICTFITSNKWLKTWYWEKLREYLVKNTNPLVLVDLWPDVFETATVDSNILIGQRKKVKEFHLKGLDLVKEKNIKNIEKFHDRVIEINNLSKDSRGISWESMLKIISKIEGCWKKLKDWKVEIVRWVITWLNEAFIIDRNKKEELISKDPKNIEIIRPILRWRDIFRYRYTFNDLYLIIVNFWDYKNLKQKYPSIYSHLEIYEKELRARWQCKYTRWWSKSINNEFEWQHHRIELDNNPKEEYMNLFEKDKIVRPMVSTWNSQFSYIPWWLFINNKGFIISWENLKFILWILNSKLVWFYFLKKESGLWKNSLEIRTKGLANLNLPIPKEVVEKEINNLVDQILEKKKENSDADTSNLEKQIDQMVYELYGLTEEEIEVVEGSV